MIRRVSIKHAESDESVEADNLTNEKETTDGEESIEVNGVDEEQSTEQTQPATEKKNSSMEKEETQKKAKNTENVERKRGPDNQTLLRLLEQVCTYWK